MRTRFRSCPLLRLALACWLLAAGSASAQPAAIAEDLLEDTPQRFDLFLTSPHLDGVGSADWVTTRHFDHWTLQIDVETFAPGLPVDFESVRAAITLTHSRPGMPAGPAQSHERGFVAVDGGGPFLEAMLGVNEELHTATLTHAGGTDTFEFHLRAWFEFASNPGEGADTLVLNRSLGWSLRIQGTHQDPPESFRVDKCAIVAIAPDGMPEVQAPTGVPPGQSAPCTHTQYEAIIENTSGQPLEIASIEDHVLGEPTLDVTWFSNDINPTGYANPSCDPWSDLPGGVLPPGERYSCVFSRCIEGALGFLHHNSVRVEATSGAWGEGDESVRFVSNTSPGGTYYTMGECAADETPGDNGSGAGLGGGGEAPEPGAGRGGPGCGLGFEFAFVLPWLCARRSRARSLRGGSEGERR